MVGEPCVHHRQVEAGILVRGVEVQTALIGQHGLRIFLQAKVGVAQVVIEVGRRLRFHQGGVETHSLGIVFAKIGTIACRLSANSRAKRNPQQERKE